MKNNATLIYNFCLVIGDALALTVAFTVAYILRVTLSSEPLSANVHAITYISILIGLLPLWILVFALLGLYNSRIHEKRFSELGRLFVGCFIGILIVISYSYMTDVAIFPARKVTIYGFALAFIFVLAFRTMARGFRRQLFNYGIGISNVLLVGENNTTWLLAKQLTPTTVSGYKILGVVGKTKQPASNEVTFKQFGSFEDAVKELNGRINTIIQTELYASADRNNEIVTFAQENHVAYRFVPGNSELFVGNIEVDLFQSVPVIAVHQTALIGWGRVVKRLFDIIVGGLMLIIASPFMLIIAVCEKLSDGGPVYFKQERLSRFNTTVKILKFRSLKIKYNGLTPEEAFTKMGRPELIKEYRANADFLPNDPRASRLGRFLRKTKLDELPQLINVVNGDISLVGPRALVPYELSQYDKKHTILSVKSGLTGLAIVSGQAGISFEDRRKLDLYYVQNWSLWTDIVILVKTVWIVITQKGTR